MRRFLALGDSYTIGEGISPSERWPTKLVELLEQRGITVATPELIARTAWTSDELADAIAAARPQGPFELVTLMVGVNDQYRGRPLEEFSRNFDPLLRTTIELAGGRPGRTVVVSIPDWGYTPFAGDRDRALISSQIGEYNAWMRTRSLAEGTAWVDATAISRAMLDDPGLVASDLLHPGAEIHRRWAEAIVPAADRALRSP